MHMVLHNTACPHLHVKLCTPFSYQINIDAVILMAKKGLLSAVASLDDVIWHSRSHHSCDLTDGGILENLTYSSGVPGLQWTAVCELLGFRRDFNRSWTVLVWKSRPDWT